MTGIGYLYQGCFKSFPVGDEAYYYTVLRYIESNPVRAEIVTKAIDWAWSSYAIRQGYESPFSLSEGPVVLPSNWSQLVHDSIAEKELKNLNNSIKRGAPLGNPEWVKETAINKNETRIEPQTKRSP
jgi:putative transposase